MTISQKIYYQSSDKSSGEAKVRKAHKALFSDSNKIQFLSSETDDTLLRIRNIANRINDDFENLLIIGAGASINIPKILFSFALTGLRVEFLETINQELLNRIFTTFVAEKTAILVISKSGNTAEVNFLLSLSLQWLSKVLGIKNIKIQSWMHNSNFVHKRRTHLLNTFL